MFPFFIQNVTAEPTQLPDPQRSIERSGLFFVVVVVVVYKETLKTYYGLDSFLLVLLLHVMHDGKRKKEGRKRLEKHYTIE